MTCILVLLMCWAGKLPAQDTASKVYRTSILAGYGVTFGRAGLVMEFHTFFENNLWLVPFAGAGLETGDNNVQGYWLGNYIGLNMEKGKDHRLLFGIGYGTHGIRYKKVYDDPDDPSRPNFTEKKLNYGPTAILGYKGYAGNGLTWQIYAGYAHTFNSQDNKRYKGFFPVAGAGIGYLFKW